MHRPRCALCALALIGLLPVIAAAQMQYPPGARVINVKDAPFNAVGDGVADDTAALNAALAAARFSGTAGKVVYLPDGVYRITDTVAFPESRITLQGESQSGTILRLDPGLPTFGDPNAPRRAFSTWEGAGFNANQFRINVFDLTVEVGAGNPGAIGVKFHCNNTGCLRDVTIRSLDPAGVGLIGLDMGGSDKGPGIVRRVTIEGFDTGIAMGGTEYGMVFEQITLRNQRVVGINNTWNILSIRGLDSDNAVPVIRNNKATAQNFAWGMITLLDANLVGGDPNSVAIENDAALYSRNLATAGYQAAIRENGAILPETSIPGEYNAQRALSVFPSPPRSLQLPILDTPEPPLGDPNTWAVVESFGADGTDGADDAAAIQAAIDSGASTIFFRGGQYFASQTIVLRGNVQRILMNESKLDALAPLASSSDPLLDVGASGPAIVLVEQGDLEAGSGRGVRHTAARTLVVRNGSWGARFLADGPGTTFIEDCVNGPWEFRNGHTVYGRQVNPENSGTKITVDNATLWLLGLKTEKPGTPIVARNGAQVELLGGLIYPVNALPIEQPMFVNDASAMTAIIGESSFSGDADHKIIVEETRNGELRRLFDFEAPGRVGFFRGVQLCLYSGFEDPNLPVPAAAIARYPLDEPAGTIATDATGNGFDGVVSGGAAFGQPGISGTALAFDGVDDFVDLPESYGLTTQQGAVSLWINSATDYTDLGHVFYAADTTDGNANGGGSQNELHVNFRSDDFVSSFIEGGSANDLGFASRAALNDGQWHHVVFSWNRDGYSELFVDGQLAGAARNQPYNIFPLNARVWLGRPNSTGRRYSGLLDEVRLYNRPVDHAEALDLYFGALPFTNYAPVADAGRPLVVQNPGYARQLEGQVNDDNQPFGPPTVLWSQVSGPPGVSFDDAGNPTATATFPQAGSYLLRLSVDDGAIVATSDVSIEVFDPLPAPWTNADIGDPPSTGWAVFDVPGDNFAVNGAGRGILGNQFTGGDAFHYAYQDINDSDGIEIVARINATGFDVNADPDARAGVNFRADIGGFAANAFVGLSPGGLIYTARSGGFGGTSTLALDPNVPANVWVRMRRLNSNTVEAAWSPDGVNWNVLGATTVNVGSPNAVLGLASASGTSAINAAVFSDARVQLVNTPPTVNVGRDRIVQADPPALQLGATISDDGLPAPFTTLWSQESGAGIASFADPADPNTTVTFDALGDYLLRLTVDDGAAAVFDELLVSVLAPLSPPWLNRDIGGVAADGFATELSTAAYEIAGAGRRIGSTGDSYHYVYQPITTSDVEVVVRVLSFDGSAPDARAGVMFSGALAGNAANALLALTPNGLIYTNRAGQNGGTGVVTTVPGITPPVYLRMRRPSGNEGRAAYSLDGVNWTDLGSVVVNVGGGTKYLGFVVCEGVNAGGRAVASFDRVYRGEACPIDLSGDGVVGLGDLGVLFGCWNTPCGDLTGDGTTDLSDLGVIFANWNQPC